MRFYQKLWLSMDGASASATKDDGHPVDIYFAMPKGKAASAAAWNFLALGRPASDDITWWAQRFADPAPPNAIVGVGWREFVLQVGFSNGEWADRFVDLGISKS
jgi:hypothetical protein